MDVVLMARSLRRAAEDLDTAADRLAAGDDCLTIGLLDDVETAIRSAAVAAIAMHPELRLILGGATIDDENGDDAC